MPETQSFHHISSAVVSALPSQVDAVKAQLATMPQVEIHASERNRIVVVIEGKSAGEVGDRLAAIALMEGVVAANLVFEHIEKEEAASHDD
jgi:periplasmic nitrate reductase NapD